LFAATDNILKRYNRLATQNLYFSKVHKHRQQHLLTQHRDRAG